ncbi:unnamed protein product [[Candida] boidinii]|nr:unnamed protein product [[Candida] boidinii]
MNTKNRILFSLAQRLTRTNVNTQTMSQLQTELEDSLSHPDTRDNDSNFSRSSTTDSSIFTNNSNSNGNYYNNANNNSASTGLNSSSSSISMNSQQNNDTTEVLKERLAGVMAKSISHSPVKITIGSDEIIDHALTAKSHTDNTGTFSLSIATPYKPSLVEVLSTENNNISSHFMSNVIEPHGVSVITDIDDTIRVTGVLGDKRDVFRNVFTKDFSQCLIPGLSDWFNILSDRFNCPIHYVSNSPWQIYNIVSQFMEYSCLPCSSIHLRQYSGNLIASFAQPSAERKRGSLVKIMKDFPSRKFVLIGDSGEQDLEAYMSLLDEFKDNIIAIYIRALPNAFSSIGEDAKVFEEVSSILSRRIEIYKSINKKNVIKEEIEYKSSAQSRLASCDNTGLLHRESSVKLNKFSEGNLDEQQYDESDNDDGDDIIEGDEFDFSNLDSSHLDTHPVFVNAKGEMIDKKPSHNLSKTEYIKKITKSPKLGAATARLTKKLPPLLPKKPISLRGNSLNMNNNGSSLSNDVNGDGNNSSTSTGALVDDKDIQPLLPARRKLQPPTTSSPTSQITGGSSTLPPPPPLSSSQSLRRPATVNRLFKSSGLSAKSPTTAVGPMSSPASLPRSATEEAATGVSPEDRMNGDSDARLQDQQQQQQQQQQADDTQYDKRRELWKSRMYNVASNLPPNIEFKFWWGIEDIKGSSIELIDKSLKEIRNMDTTERHNHETTINDNDNDNLHDCKDDYNHKKTAEPVDSVKYNEKKKSDHDSTNPSPPPMPKSRRPQPPLPKPQSKPIVSSKQDNQPNLIDL